MERGRPGTARYSGRATAARRRRPATAERRPGRGLGPRWDLVGPGDAYVRAMSEEKKAPYNDQLRPRPRPDGAIVLLRDGEVIRGFPRLQDAADAANAGDSIEIRTDGPIPGANFRKKVDSLMLAAAPGYRPVISGKLESQSLNLLQVVGIDFSEEGPTGNGFGRFVNCSWKGGSGYRSTNAAEFVRCQLPYNLTVNTRPDAPVAFRHCLIQGLTWYGMAEGKNQLLLDHCVVWAPGNDCGVTLLRGGGSLAVTAHATIFEAAGQTRSAGAFITGIYGPKLTEWSGNRNVYRIGRRQWLLIDDTRTADLAAWRQKWTSDADSFEAAPLDYDPQQWRLLPQSPGHRQGPDGKDYGADVDQVARLAK